MIKDAWNPQQYDKFKDERSQPFFDLMDLLVPQENAKVIDLGCGTGELTTQLHKKVKASSTVGMDSSEEMLKKAENVKTPGLTFTKDNIESWHQPKSYDIIFTNAALQWCSDHPGLFKRLKDSLHPGGQLAIQMPMNHDYPTHVLANQMALEDAWVSKLGTPKIKGSSNMLTADAYASMMFDLGFKSQKVNVRVYGHILDSRDGVIEWVKGTLLTRMKSKLSEEDYQVFLAEFRTRLFEQLPDNKPFFYPFKRILIWGQL